MIVADINWVMIQVRATSAPSSAVNRSSALSPFACCHGQINHSNLLTRPVSYRGPLHGQYLRRLRAPFFRATQPVLNPHRSPHRRPARPDMFRLGSRGTLPFASSLAAIPPRSPYPNHSDPPRYPSCFPGRHSLVCPAHELGWMDCAGSYHPHHCIFSCHLRHAKNTSKQESAQEAHRRECGHEWCQLLRQPQSEPLNGGRSRRQPICKGREPASNEHWLHCQRKGNATVRCI